MFENIVSAVFSAMTWQHSRGRGWRAAVRIARESWKTRNYLFNVGETSHPACFDVLCPDWDRVCCHQRKLLGPWDGEFREAVPYIACCMCGRVTQRDRIFCVPCAQKVLAHS